MASSLNKVMIAKSLIMYSRGFSIPQVSDANGISRTGLRYHLKKAGILRDRGSGLKIAAENGRLGGGFRGKRRKFTETHCKNISRGRQVWAKENAAGVSFKSNGYVEFTAGPNKGRSVHVVRMELRIGRCLSKDECVHHIDGNKHNNDDNNLALVTYSGHMRLHRYEDKLSGKERKRDKNGRFS